MAALFVLLGLVGATPAQAQPASNLVTDASCS
jgi:hypothetical protein